MSIVEDDMPTLTEYMAAGADPNMADYRGSSLLHVAAGLGRLDAVGLMTSSVTSAARPMIR